MPVQTRISSRRQFMRSALVAAGLAAWGGAPTQGLSGPGHVLSPWAGPARQPGS
ncbi:MAG: hypothetical protein ABIR35_08330 [Polaromonas sp.]